MHIYLEKQHNPIYDLYFHSNDCAVCEQTNTIIDRYIELGYQNYIPIYFATKESAPTLFANEDLGLTVTPTIVVFDTENNEYQVYEGYMDISMVITNTIYEAKGGE